MKTNTLLMGICVAFMVSCGGTPSKKTVETPVFGETFEVTESLTVPALVAALAPNEDMEAVVTGTVTEVCQSGGCWMRLATAEEGKTILVKTNHDYELPKDIAGKTVVMKGKAFNEILSVEALQHYAADAGKTKEEIAAITEPKQTITFDATGVKLLN